jgi:hypothetical protein
LKAVPRLIHLAALAAAWLGYFSPWLWPVPVALRLSAHDLVEWMTFEQTVRDGTFPVTRLDLLWPLAGIALLTALALAHLHDPSFASEPARLLSVLLRPDNLGGLALDVFAAYLILPAYPFLITAYRDPELAPQFWLGVASALAALLVSVLSLLRPAWAVCLTPLIALVSLIASIRACLLVAPPIAGALTHPVPLGYGAVLAVAGFGVLALLSGMDLGRRLLRGGVLSHIRSEVDGLSKGAR